MGAAAPLLCCLSGSFFGLTVATPTSDLTKDGAEEDLGGPIRKVAATECHRPCVSAFPPLAHDNHLHHLITGLCLALSVLSR